MMRSMFSAVSALRAHQLRMDVIGNNIANVNTVGFKGSRVTFQDVFSQTLKGAGSPQEGRGGTNPHQVGLGVNVASMDTFHIRGAVERTDYNTDVMINGEGFFIVSDDRNFLNRYYTRAGNFALDEDGNLVTADGLKVLGYMADENGVLGSSLQGLVISRATTFDAKVTENVKFEGNLDSETEVFTGADGIVGPDDTSDSVYWEIDNGGIIKYEVNPAYQNTIARETTFEVYDQLGGIHKIQLSFVKTDVREFHVQAFYIEDNGNMIPAGTGGFTSAPAAHVIEFTPEGKIDPVSTPNFGLQIPDTLTNGADSFTFEVDLSKLTMFANQSTASATSIDGFKQGTLEDFAIAPTGEIIGAFSNGQRKIIGKIALANFKNPAGLEKTSANLYRTTLNSGEPMIGEAGSGGFGTLNPGALEMSNVDLSKEFTNMITTQRGFQANTRIITTSDEMLQELVNMKR